MAICQATRTTKERTMSVQQQPRDHRRFRLATNDNETIVEDELDVEGHRLATNDNETTIEKLRRVDDDGDEMPGSLGGRTR